MEVLIKTIDEAYEDLQKGRGPDKKPRKKRGSKSDFKGWLESLKPKDEESRKMIEGVKQYVVQHGVPQHRDISQPSQSSKVGARQIAQRKMWEGSNYYGPNR